LEAGVRLHLLYNRVRPSNRDSFSWNGLRVIVVAETSDFALTNIVYRITPASAALHVGCKPC
jgi:hypothetical protein